MKGDDGRSEPSWMRSRGSGGDSSRSRGSTIRGGDHRAHHNNDSTTGWTHGHPSLPQAHDVPRPAARGRGGGRGGTRGRGRGGFLTPSSSYHTASSASSWPTVDRKTRDLNKRLRALYEEKELVYGDDVLDEDTLVDRFATAVKISRKSINRVLTDLKQAYRADVCFLVDVTGSMQPHINGVKDQINKIVSELCNSVGGQQEIDTLRLAFVGYRDFCDKASGQFEVLPFTEDVEAFRAFVGSIRASGGGAPLADVFGGLQRASSLAWHDQAGTRVLFHICDYPCHGRDYHDEDYYDLYPAGDPEGRTSKALFGELRAKWIQYHFGEITKHTEKMISIFSRDYGDKITPFDVKNAIDIKESVVSAVSLSVQRSLNESKSATRGLTIREFTIDPVVPDWSRIREQKGSFLSYDLPSNIKDVVDGNPLGRKAPKRNRIIKVAEHPFGEGSERIAYYGLQIIYDKYDTAMVEPYKLALKEYKHIGKNVNSSARYEIANELQTVAAYFAQLFDKDHGEAGLRLKFLKVKTLCITFANGINRFMSCERLLEKSAEFIRFSNNAEYKILAEKMTKYNVDKRMVELLMAFSHWTCHATNGNMMIVDLQGAITKDPNSGQWNLLLTDPAIHCKDVTRYRPMNLGVAGMRLFFEKHRCNRICLHLKLKSARELLG